LLVGGRRSRIDSNGIELLKRPRPTQGCRVNRRRRSNNSHNIVTSFHSHRLIYKLKGKGGNAIAMLHVKMQVAEPTAQFNTLHYLQHLCVKSEKPQWQFRGLNMRHNTWFLRCCFEVIKTIFGLSDVNELKDTFIS